MGQDEGQKAKVHSDFVGKGFVTGEDVSDTSVIVIGRGKKAPVMKQVVMPSFEETEETLGLTFDDLAARVEESDLPSAEKQSTHVNLESLRFEVERGEAGDVQVVRQTLDDIGSAVPELREPLRDWLVEMEQVPTPIKIIARKMLS